MALKLDGVEVLICATMLAYLVAFAALQWERHETGRLIFGIGFLTGLAAFIARWFAIGHLPLQSMFEVFLCLGIIVFPLSIFCRKILNTGLESLDPLIGFVLLFPAAFIFASTPQNLPPALQSPLFGPHVAAYMLAYVILFKSAIIAGQQFVAPVDDRRAAQDAATFRLVRFAFPLLTVGLVLGAWWGNLAWGDYWHWDPKELWSLATWLVFAGYLHIRSAYGSRYARLNAALVFCGCQCIVLTLVWVNLAGKLFAGLHTYAT